MNVIPLSENAMACVRGRVCVSLKSLGPMLEQAVSCKDTCPSSSRGRCADQEKRDRVNDDEIVHRRDDEVPENTIGICRKESAEKQRNEIPQL